MPIIKNMTACFKKEQLFIQSYPLPHIHDEAMLFCFKKSATGVMNDASLQCAASSVSQADALSLAVTQNHINLTTR